MDHCERCCGLRAGIRFYCVLFFCLDTEVHSRVATMGRRGDSFSTRRFITLANGRNGIRHLGLWFFAVAAALSWIIYTIALRLTLSRTHSGNKQAAQVLPAEVQPMSHSRRRFSPRLRVLVTVIIITSMVSFMFIEKLVFRTRSGLLVDVLAVLIILAVIWIVAPRSS
jgi:hypothetical protein